MLKAHSKIVIASDNAGKLEEFGALLNNCGLDPVAQSQFNVGNVEETGLSFVENAILKARNASRQTGMPSLADDSGLEVDALNGAPGIYSARYAGEGANEDDNNRKLLQQLKGVPFESRTARYRCLIVLMHHANDPTPMICQGSWEGRIGAKPQGDGGFGYDPLFIPHGNNVTAAQLSVEEKNSVSHRAAAMRVLLQQLILETEQN